MLATQLQILGRTLGMSFWAATEARADSTAVSTSHCGQPAEGKGTLAVQRRERLVRALAAGFGVQYWGETFTADNLAAAPHGVFIIEIAKAGADASYKSREVLFSADEIQRIGRNGLRPVLGYLNLAKIEPYRDYWVDALALMPGRDTMIQGDTPWIGRSLGRDGTLARFWTQDWEDILIDRVGKLMQQGIDGLFLDDVLQYFAYYSINGEGRSSNAAAGDPVSAGEFARAMMKLVGAVAAAARQHDCKSFIVINNGVFIKGDAGVDPTPSSPGAIEQYLSAIDGILIESVFAGGGDDAAISILHQEFASAGVPVLTVDFADVANVSKSETRTEIGRRALSEGFIPYVADDATFNRLYPPISSFGTIPTLP